jgi:tRNA pseudouridine55 synthase
MRARPIHINTTMTTSRPNADQAESGIVVIDKPAGWTSHQVVAKIRRLAGTRKVGHAGTLDPMATGVLVIGIGRATRLLGYLALTEKAYAATIRLGVSTVSDDAEGDVITAPGEKGVTDEQIETALATLRGELMQVPSAVSAIKIDGVRAYAKVRSGHEVDLAPRPVTVDRFEVVGRFDREVDGVAVVDLDVLVECSSGTYVRALARDLGTTLGTGGHVTTLQRTRVGTFTLDQTQTLEEAERQLKIIPLDRVAHSSFATLTVNEAQASYIRNGRRLVGVSLPDGIAAIFDEAGIFLALYRQEGPDAIAEAVLSTGSMGSSDPR